MAKLLAVSPGVYTCCENGDATPQFATIVKIGDILNVIFDELAGRQDSGVSDARIHNPELPRLYQKINRLSDEDRKALVIVLGNLVKRSKVSRVMAEL